MEDRPSLAAAPLAAAPTPAPAAPPAQAAAADACPITTLVRGYLAMLMGPPAPVAAAATPPARAHRSHRHHHHHHPHRSHEQPHGDSGGSRAAREQAVTTNSAAGPEDPCPSRRKASSAAAAIHSPPTTATATAAEARACPPSCCCPLHVASVPAAACTVSSSSALVASLAPAAASSPSSQQRFPSAPPASSAVPLTQWMTCLSEADLAWMRAQPCLLQASHRMRQQAEAAAAAAAAAASAAAASSSQAVSAASSTPVASVPPQGSSSAHSLSSLRARSSPSAGVLPALAAPLLPIPSPGPSPAAGAMCQTDLFRSTMARCDLDETLRPPSLIQCLRARQTHATPEAMRGSGLACSSSRRNGVQSLSRQRCPDPVSSSPSSLQRSCTLAKGVPSWLRSMHHYESRVFGAQFDHAGRNLLVVTQDQHLRLYNLSNSSNSGGGGRGDAETRDQRERSQRRSHDYDAEPSSHVGSRIFDSRVSSDVPSSASPRSSSAPSGSPCLAASSSASSSSRSTIASAARVDAGWDCTLDTRGLNVGWSIVGTDFSPDDSLIAYSTWSPLVHLVSTDPARKYLPASPPEPVKSCFFSKLSPKSCSSNNSGSSSGGTIGRASRLVPNSDGVTHIPLQFRRSSCVSRFCIFSVAFSPGAGDTLLGGASDRAFYLYDLAADRVAWHVPAHAEDVNAVLWMDEHVLLTGGDDKLIKIWDRRTLGGAPAASTAAAGTSCGTSAAAASAAAEPSACQSLLNMLCPSSRPRPAPVGCFAGHTQGLTSLAARGADGRHVLSNSKDQSAKIWDLRRMSRPAEVEAAFAARAAAAAGGADAAAAQSTGGGGGAAGGGGCSQWDYRWPTHVSKAAAAVDPVTKHQQHAAQSAVAACLAALSPAIPASYIGASANAGAGGLSRAPPAPVKPCALDTSLMTFTGHHVLETLVRAYFSPGESTGHRFVYAGSQSGAVMVWDALTGQMVRKLAGHYGTVRDVTWHPSLPMLVSSSWDCSIARWEVPPN